MTRKMSHPGLQQLYEAGLLFRDNLISLEEVSYRDKKLRLDFKVKEYDVTLIITPINSHQYSKGWYCTCMNSGLSGYSKNLECKHIRAAEYYVINKLTFHYWDLMRSLKNKEKKNCEVEK